MNMAPPKKRAAPKTEPKAATAFVEGLRFVSLALKDEGQPNETHALLENKWAKAFNGFIALGHPIAEDILAAPQNKLMLSALSYCGDELSITQLDNARIAIKSAKFRAVVPCVQPDLLGTIEPDTQIALLNDDFRSAVEAVSSLVVESGSRVFECSILLRPGSVIATDGTVLLEAWHGIDMPPDMVLPKAGIAALCKIKSKLVGFGFSPSSVTFHYENGAWLRCQLWADKWPVNNIERILATPANLSELPHEFFKALAAVSQFSEDGHIHFHSGIMRSHSHEAAGASYEVYGLPGGPVFSAKKLKLIEPYAQVIDFIANGQKMLYFKGERVRGVIMGLATNA